MKILVTGSSGFIGKIVCAELRKKGHTIIPYDRTTGHDILNSAQLTTAMRKVEACIHLAAIVENDAKNLWEINVTGTENVVHAAEKTHLKKLVFLSSTGVYGYTTSTVDEKSPTAPENEYERSKVIGEKLVLGTLGKTKVSIVRSAMVFGANAYWKGMFRMLQKKYPLPCSGTNTFQVMYAPELAKILALVLTKGKDREIYLAAGKEQYTLNEFCEHAQKGLGLTPGINHIPTFVGLIAGKLLRIRVLTRENIRHLSKERKYTTTKLTQLGYTQKIILTQAITKVITELTEKK